MACPPNPKAPEGYRVWRQKAVPKPLEQWAVELRDRWMPTHNFGDTTTMVFTDPATAKDTIVLARKDYHTWTYHQGRLVTGICIPGITLYESLLTQALAGAAPGVGQYDAGGGGETFDEAVPDPTAARYSQDIGTDWGLVAATAGAAAAIVVAFWAGLKLAGRVA